MKSRLAVAALDNAVARRRIDGGAVDGCILHTDRGSQFRARKMHRALSRHSMVGSMGQVGSAADNAAMESFFSLLQGNVLDRRRWTTRDDLRIAIVTWTERTYHRRRRQNALGRLTPIEYETIMTVTAAQAALPEVSPTGAVAPCTPVRRPATPTGSGCSPLPRWATSSAGSASLPSCVCSRSPTRWPRSAEATPHEPAACSDASCGPPAGARAR